MSCRALVIGLLAVIEKFRAAPLDHPDFQPLVSVLIPAYNEEEVIVYTVNSVLESDYPKLEVIVVDDGSTDGTGDMLDSEFGRNPAVRVIHQPNRGKPAALSHALAEASSGIIVTIDADTSVEPNAVIQTRPPLRQSRGWRRGRKRKGRKPRQLAHALAGARIRDQPEP